MLLTDIHCHMLPKVDDGPSTVAEAKELLKMVYDTGVRRVIVTPHYRVDMFEPDMRNVVRYFRWMRYEASRIDPGFKIYLGCEHYTDSNLVENLQKKRTPAMAGSNYVLVEFSAAHSYQKIRNQIYELVVNGYQPIIAHMERYPVLLTDMSYVRELVELGAYMQLNAASVLGDHGKKVKQFCKKAMKENLVEFIGSDTHGVSFRTPNLDKCAKYVAKKMGKVYAEQIFVKNPEKILRCARDMKRKMNDELRQ